MSWLFSQALVEASSAATCLDGEPSAPLSGSPTQLAYLPPDRMTAFSRPSRSGMTFRPLTDDLGAAVLTWCLEASRARTSAWPAKAQELTGNDQACGATWRGSLARFDPATSSWRTAQPSLLEDLGESSVIWPRSGMTAGGQCWELPMSGHRISGTGSGLSETWPTPRACSAMAANITPEAIAKAEDRFPNLETVVARRMWPTPNAGNEKWGGTMQEWGGSQNWVRKEMPELASGALNPTWVEWLMGWPLGWTDLKPLATDRFPCVPQPLGECLPVAA